MSYILDALRKADAQRVRDPARGIHAQPAGQPPAPATRSRRGEQAMWIGAVLVLCIAAWLWFGREEARPPVTSPDLPPGAVLPNHSPPRMPSPPAAAVLPPAPPPVIVARPAPMPPVAAVPPMAVAPAGPLPPAGPVPGAAPPTGNAVPLPAVPPVRTTRLPPGATAAASAPAAGGPGERIFNFADLPADIQQAFPKLAISGGVYSANVAQRMLIVNGQVFNEGSELAPGVVLEQLRPKSAVLRFRGTRIAQPY